MWIDQKRDAALIMPQDDVSLPWQVVMGGIKNNVGYFTNDNFEMLLLSFRENENAGMPSSL